VPQLTIRTRRAASRVLLTRCFVALLAAAATATASAADTSVPYVPTPQVVVDRMLQMAKVGPTDYLIDLGSGDGRIVVTAATKYGARGFGVDLNPQRIAEANANAAKAGVTDKVSFMQRDLFETGLEDATVVTMYLLPRVNIALRPRLLELKPGTRIVSHDFSMEDWKPDAHVTIDAPDKYGGTGGVSDIYHWVVPARVNGSWQWELPIRGKPVTYDVTLQQQYQMITGTVRTGGRGYPLQQATLQGERITFAFVADVGGSAVRHELTGRVQGDGIEGGALLTGATLQGQLDWSARRLPGTPAGAAQPITR
jgi:hypothetical protein